MFTYYKLIVTDTKERSKEIVDSFRDNCESISYRENTIRVNGGLVIVRDITSYEKAKEVGCGSQFSSIEFTQPCVLDIASIQYLLSRLRFFNPYRN